jgi:hypothetical protein
MTRRRSRQPAVANTRDQFIKERALAEGVDLALLAHLLNRCRPVSAHRARALGYAGALGDLPRDETQVILCAKHVAVLLRDFAGNRELAVAAHFAGSSVIHGLAARYGNSFDAIKEHLPDEAREAAAEVLAQLA